MKRSRRNVLLGSLAVISATTALEACKGGTPDKPSKSASVIKNKVKWKMATAFPKNFPGSDLNAQKIKKRLIAEIAKARKTSQKIIGCGASAKGNTLLNFSKINLDYIVDDNPIKQNTFTPGMRIPVKSRKSLTRLKKNKRVTFLLLVWSNLYKEIKMKIKKIRKSKKDRFIMFFPKVMTLK